MSKILKYLFDKAGFVDASIKPMAGIFTTLVLKWNYFSRRLIRGPKPLRLLIHGTLRIIWYLNQHLAPYLDKLDKNWDMEAPGYFISARKKT